MTHLSDDLIKYLFQAFQKKKYEPNYQSFQYVHFMLESKFELHKYFCGLIRAIEHSNHCEPCQIKVSQHFFSEKKK